MLTREERSELKILLRNNIIRKCTREEVREKNRYRASFAPRTPYRNLYAYYPKNKNLYCDTKDFSVDDYFEKTYESNVLKEQFFDISLYSLKDILANATISLLSSEEPEVAEILDKYKLTLGSEVGRAYDATVQEYYESPIYQKSGLYETKKLYTDVISEKEKLNYLANIKFAEREKAKALSQNSEKREANTISSTRKTPSELLSELKGIVRDAQGKIAVLEKEMENNSREL